MATTIIADVKMFDKNLMDIYIQRDDEASRKIGSFETKDCNDVILSFAQHNNAETVFLIGNKSFCEGLKESLAKEEKERYGASQLLINIV